MVVRGQKIQKLEQDIKDLYARKETIEKEIESYEHTWDEVVLRIKQLESQLNEEKEVARPMSKSQQKRFAVQSRRPPIPPNKRHERKHWEEDDPMKDIADEVKQYFIGADEEESE